MGGEGGETQTKMNFEANDHEKKEERLWNWHICKHLFGCIIILLYLTIKMTV